MYKKILIPLENSAADDVIVDHVTQLAKLTGASVLLIHVADGFVARYQDMLNLSDSEEIVKDRAYLERRALELAEQGIRVDYKLERGEPSKVILALVAETGCDLVAMATHGHKFLGDLIFGTVAEHVRHRTDVPILMIKAPKK
jgi:nucleotide-binding universal stress UspA family protein